MLICIEGVTHKISLQLFDSIVSSVLEFGCDIWSTGNKSINLLFYLYSSNLDVPDISF